MSFATVRPEEFGEAAVMHGSCVPLSVGALLGALWVAALLVVVEDVALVEVSVLVDAFSAVV